MFLKNKKLHHDQQGELQELLRNKEETDSDISDNAVYI